VSPQMGGNSLKCRMWITFLYIFLLVSQGTIVSAVNPCSDPKTPGGVWQYGCLVKTCISGTVEESLAEECVEKIEEKVDRILDEKFAEKGILISGGDGTGTVEVYSLNNHCVLPSLPVEMADHTSDEGTLCGGDYSRNTCITFSSGKWVTSHALAQARSLHTSWNNKEEGKIILLGGYYSRTSETITEGENNGVPGFPMKYKTWQACAITEETSVIITGGRDTLRTVSRYGTGGHIEDLPSLNQGRINHGCGAYTDDSGEQVLLVVGGRDDGWTSISSTELLPRSSSAWVTVNSLPRKISGVRVATMGGSLYLTGGHGYDEEDGKDKMRDNIYKWTGQEWLEVGKMKKARNCHAVSTIKLGKIKDFCT